MMKHTSRTFGAIAGGVTSLAIITLFYLGQQLMGWPFTPFDFFDWLARALPGGVITFGIDSIVSLIQVSNTGLPTDEMAKLIEQVMALGLFMIIGATTGFLIAAVGRRAKKGVVGWIGVTITFILFVAFAITVYRTVFVPSTIGMVWLAILFIGWGWILGRLIDGARHPVSVDDESYKQSAGRRQALAKIAGGSLAIALGGWGLGYLLRPNPTRADLGEPMPETATEMADVATDPTELENRLEPAPGTRPEVDPPGEFYRIDINTRVITLERDSWELAVAGLFDNPRNLTLNDLMSYPAITQPLTLSCISNRIGGDLIGTARWTGARLTDVLDDLGIQPDAQELMIEAADGFFESVAQADWMDPRTLLVYAMNDTLLPQKHGFPLRIYIPNRYGMKQPKWITRIEAIGQEGSGYWVERGWSEEARPRIISMIDTIAQDAQDTDGRIPIGGIAWAGDRGIEQVEIQVDEGDWQVAQLRTPPLSTLTWVQWRFDWPAEPGSHTFRVRATDGSGTLQIGEMGVRPDGATGYHQVTETIS